MIDRQLESSNGQFKYFWKFNFPVNPYFHLLVDRFELKGVTHPCTYRTTCKVKKKKQENLYTRLFYFGYSLSRISNFWTDIIPRVNKNKRQQQRSWLNVSAKQTIFISKRLKVLFIFLPLRYDNRKGKVWRNSEFRGNLWEVEEEKKGIDGIKAGGRLTLRLLKILQ